jgi:hypothetical protein
MNEGIYFADAELPFHVWVREQRGDGYRWVLRETRGASEGKAADEAPAQPEGDGPEAAAGPETRR